MADDNILLGLDIDLTQLERQLSQANQMLERKMKKVNVTFDIDERSLNSLRDKIENLKINLPNVQGGGAQSQSAQLQKLIEVAGRGQQRVPDIDMKEMSQSQEKFTDGLKDGSDVLLNFSNVIVDTNKGLVTYTRAQKDAENAIKGFGREVGRTRRQVRGGGIMEGITSGYQMGRGGLGGIAGGLGGLLRGGGMAGLASIGGIATMGMLGVGAAAGLGAYGLYRGYGQMMSEQPERLGLIGKLGVPQYEDIARTGGALYNTGLGYNINQQLQMANQFARVMGGRGLTGAMQTGMQAERLFGVDIAQTQGLAGAAFRMGGGAEDIQSVFRNAVTAGIDDAKLTVMIPQVMTAATALAEQNFAAFGRSTLDEMSDMLSRLYVASGESPMLQPERAARLVGTMGERIRGVAFGGGDVAQRAFMYRAFESQAQGEPFDYLDFMLQAERGTGLRGENITAVMRQAGREFGMGGSNQQLMDLFRQDQTGRYVNREQLAGFRQFFAEQFGFTTEQTKGLVEAFTKIEGVRGLSAEDKQKRLQEEIEKRKEQVFNRTPEGRLLKSQTDLTNTLSSVGEKLYGVGITMNETMTSMVNPLRTISEGIAKMTGVEVRGGGLIAREREIEKEMGGLEGATLGELLRDSKLSKGLVAGIESTDIRSVEDVNRVMQMSGLGEMAKAGTGTIEQTAIARAIRDALMSLIQPLKEGVRDGVMEGQQSVDKEVGKNGAENFLDYLKNNSRGTFMSVNEPIIGD